MLNISRAARSWTSLESWEQRRVFFPLNALNCINSKASLVEKLGFGGLFNSDGLCLKDIEYLLQWLRFNDLGALG